MTHEKSKDGGSAFPGYDKELQWHEEGMTLRDYFAAKAMQGMLVATYTDTEDHKPNYCKWHAGHAYEMADAMLRERER